LFAGRLSHRSNAEFHDHGGSPSASSEVKKAHAVRKSRRRGCRSQ
jgi:hypothetical protein